MSTMQLVALTTSDTIEKASSLALAVSLTVLRFTASRQLA